MAKKHYGPIQPVEIPALKPRPEIPQSGERRLTLALPATIDYLMMGYKVPSLSTASEDWEVYALEVLAWILDGGSSSRFSKELLRDQQLVASTSVSYDLYSRLETLLMLSAVPAKGKEIDDVEAALRAQIKRLQDELVSDEELQRIKTQIMAGAVYERDSIFYQAMQLGSLETVGIGWQADGQFVDKIRAVTRDQIKAVARKYLTDDRLTVAILDPQPMNTAAVSPAASGNHRH